MKNNESIVTSLCSDPCATVSDEIKNSEATVTPLRSDPYATASDATTNSNAIVTAVRRTSLGTTTTARTSDARPDPTVYGQRGRHRGSFTTSPPTVSNEMKNSESTSLCSDPCATASDEMKNSNATVTSLCSDLHATASGQMKNCEANIKLPIYEDCLNH